MAPFNAYLTLTGIETLKLRMQKHMSNALKVATFLKSHKKIDHVFWAGFKDNPSYKLAKNILALALAQYLLSQLSQDMKELKN